MAGFGVIIHKVDWIDIVWIWAYDIAWLLAIDALKWGLKTAGPAWMSAGAAGGVLGYADLPEDVPEGCNQRSQLGSNLRSALMHSRASNARSMLNSRVTGQGSYVGRGGGSIVSVRGGSTLPFPHNVRAAALRHNNSF